MKKLKSKSDTVIAYVAELVKGHQIDDSSRLPFCVPRTEQVVKEVISVGASALLHTEQTEENVLRLLEHWKGTGNIFNYIHVQTEAICLAVVNKSPLLLEYVIDQTRRVCLAAISINTRSLSHVHEQTEEIVLKAISINPSAIQYATLQTETIIDAVVLAAKNNDEDSLIRHLWHQNEALELKILNNDLFYAIKYFKHPSPQFVLKAIECAPALLTDLPVRLQCKEVVDIIISKQPELLARVRLDLLDNAVCTQLVREGTLQLIDCPLRTREIELAAVQFDWRQLRHVTEFTEEVCVAAYEQDVCALGIMCPEYGAFEGELNSGVSKISKYNRYYPLLKWSDINRSWSKYPASEAKLLALDTQRKLEVALNAKASAPDLKKSSRTKMDVI